MITRILRWLINLFTPTRDIVDASEIILATDTITVKVNKPVIEVKPKTVQKIFPILFYGHGPMTKGKKSPKYNGFQFIEYEYNKRTVEIIKDKLDSLGWKYAIGNDYLVDCYGNCIPERVQIIKYLISVPAGLEPIIIDQHANAHTDSWNNVTGSETWIADVLANRAKRLLYAQIFQDNMVKRHQSRDRGIKMNNNRRFPMLYDTPYLSFILEPEFYTNIEKAKYLANSGDEMQAGAVIDSLRQINEL